MAQHIIIKRKDGITTLLAVKVNLKRAEKIVERQQDKNAVYHIAEVVETISPNNTENETRESI